ncbi:Cytochrome bo(3) ubiquinol oxidase subunit 3 [Candidatus Annandia adelgestsuga]|uniref:Cytochrome bo(3) ubiquinol oxidase subunit 3 n=1 Tax=Candidatus Annandia adelgestsuga TaxID=1302411 RepID=A0A3Q9CPG2_9ENTR|nr:cytochrome c oxidase subunit 3 [Candidatus Annandia adelgestsuga]AZP36380.1 Cytochrome bo(3) ubiquinol oxidase subunit 3 [Candidatus Annandia adelgestsuga]
MSDCIIFSILFVTYSVILNNVTINFINNIFNIYLVFIETIVLLLSSFSYCIINICIKKKYIFFTIFFLFITFLLGSVFLNLELYELCILINKGLGPQKNGFMSIIFTILSIHGVHIFIGLTFILNLITHVILNGINKINYNKIIRLGLFWHFLDIIWVFIFTIIYIQNSL